MDQNLFIWLIAIITTSLVIMRPFKLPEAIWAVFGAFILMITGLISFDEAFFGIKNGTDVYLFLVGMMLLAETAKEEKLFDWLAAFATRISKGSSLKLFILIYLVGIFVTVFLSNDATAVVLTPAVIAAMKASKVKNPLPYLFICAFIANAVSFVLPISNPANLVIYGKEMPPLFVWLKHFALPSIAAILMTYLMLYLSQRNNLKQKIETNIELPKLGIGGKAAALGIGFTAVVLLTASTFNLDLGLPTAITGILTSIIVLIISKKSPLKVIKGVSWSVLPLVAGLFIIVEAVNSTGIINQLASFLTDFSAKSPDLAVWISGFSTAFGSNLTNNLPAGLITGSTLQIAQVPEMLKNAALIGIDLGPNLSVTGSLATILWLVALRKEGYDITAWQFLKIGFIVMVPALIITLAVLFL
ncbi:arsenic transporter [Halpernia frigidisoli]|uniref:Arsenite efflux membrane protein ArsB n=1 Tax=Halpernia frigidisoli TaxID=1125876 RepID=A0A1I3J1G0_9FLAO|nr:arsenic transporter [Halpernia frigidisoli]SFI54112.1 arsenite efflux membrane protein ArsB [Halpernia frigidisoli]